MNVLIRFLFSLFVLVIIGCASDAPHVRYAQPMPPGARILQDDKVYPTITADPGIRISAYEKDRFAGQIVRAIRETARGSAKTPFSYVIQVHLTKYGRGSAVARAILAGLGEMHIEGDVSVLQSDVRIAQFRIEKTFAWGGIYGATTGIADVEKGFAQGVANAVCGVSN
jgi:hypothetical protein